MTHNPSQFMGANEYSKNAAALMVKAAATLLKSSGAKSLVWN